MALAAPLVRRATPRKVVRAVLAVQQLANLFPVFVCVAALAILDRLDIVNTDTLAWWLAERQLPNGGLNGRPEKLEDVRRVISHSSCHELTAHPHVYRCATASGCYRHCQY